MVRSAAVRQFGAGFLEQLAHFLDADGDGVELAKDALRVLGDDVGEGGLAAAGRAVEDHRAEAIRLQQPAQQLARAEEVLLADELVERCAAACGRRAAGPSSGWRRGPGETGR